MKRALIHTSCTMLLLGFVGSAITALRAVDFQKEVDPILVKRCYECHGPDQQKSKLRLDSRADAFKGGKSGKPAIVPGKSSESELIARVTSQDPDEVMPPKGARLEAKDVAALKEWIDSGATWPEVKLPWAFKAPVHPSIPAPRLKRWTRNEIDQFVLSRLEKEKLQPSVEADKATLIRRVTLDLTGLPPSLEEVDAFVNDRSKDAYEKVVNRLFNSAHHGEHMARWWLDLARYADSNGYQVDLARSIWPYRQWVIDAFNRNMRFDQFTIEQLAGDLLPNPTLEQKIATGFNRNTKINDEGGGDAEEYRTKAVKDRVATTATTWLGLTMMCAECHTHKYDPITQDEYYKFYSFFNNTTDGGNYSVEPTVAVPPPSLESKVRFIREQLFNAKAELAKAEQAWSAQQEKWEQRVASRTNVWTTLELTNLVSTGGATLTNLEDGSVLSKGLNPIYDTIIVEAESPIRNVTAVLLEVLPDPSLPKEGPGRWDRTGNFILDEMSLTTLDASAKDGKGRSLAFGKARADWEQEYYRAEHALDRNPKTGWAIGPQFGKRHFLIAELKQSENLADGTKLSFRFDHYHGSSHTIGRFRISVTSQTDPEAQWPVPSEIARIAATPRQERTPEHTKELAAYFRTVSPEIRRLDNELFELNRRESALVNMKFTTLVLTERTEPRQTFVHVRGNFLEKGKEVTPGVPAALPPLPPTEVTNRLTLAKWLVDPANPLTARVTVNRLWEGFFGTGLVKTSDDFGKQGEAPSHPELLDWLATEFVRTGWDMRAIQRLIVLSATYRQSARATDELLAKDLYNRLLARGPRFRMDAEMIRDNALAVSGLLNLEIGGPSVYPVQPANLWKEIGFLRPEIGMDEWPLSEGPDLYRRGMYTFWRRVCTYPTFATFDAPSREVCVARRPRTNTPLQALAGLNEPTLLEAARALAQRVMLHGGESLQSRVDYAFRLCTSRTPSKPERQRVLAYFQDQARGFKNDLSAAEQLLAVGSCDRPEGLDSAQLAAWMMVANVLLNLDETITKG